MSFVNKKHTAVKDRFRRFKEKLMFDAEGKEQKKSKPVMEEAYKKSKNVKNDPAKPSVSASNAKRNETLQPSPSKKKCAITNLDKKVNEKDKNTLPLLKDTKKRNMNRKKSPETKVSEIPSPSKKIQNTRKNIKDIKKNIVKNGISKKKNLIAARFSEFQKKINRQPNQLHPTKILENKYTPSKKIPKNNANSDSMMHSSSLQLISKSYKIPKVNEVTGPSASLPSLSAEDYLMEVDFNDDLEIVSLEVNQMRNRLNEQDDNKNSPFLGNCHWDPIENALILVVDTNIYISNLSLVEKLCEIEVPGYGAPLVYVPRRVICELDGLKSQRNLEENHKVNVSEGARAAIRFLNSHLSISNASVRVKGQTMEQNQALAILNIDDSDDKILLSCLQLKQNYPDKRVILLSNDINLRCKAIIESVETFSANEFDDKVSNNFGTYSLEHQIDTVLKAVFYEIIHVECVSQTHFKTLKIAVTAFTNYWPNTFSYLSPVAAEENLKRLKLIINDSKVDYLELLETAKNFLSYFLIKSKPYYTKVNQALNFCKDAVCQLKTIKTQEKTKNGCLALQEIFQQCWIVLQDQLNKIYNESNFVNLSEHISKVIVDFGNSINKILAFPSEDHVKMLASSIRICLNGSIETYSEIVHAVIVSDEGRNLLITAANVFEDALRKIPKVSNPTS